MLHRMAVVSAGTILHTLECQTRKAIAIIDLVEPIPDSTEEQEKLLQVKVTNFLALSNFNVFLWYLRKYMRLLDIHRLIWKKVLLASLPLTFILDQDHNWQLLPDL